MTTKISDIVIPEVFVPYVIERTAELSALIQSGIVIPDPQLNILAQSGGKIINMPFFTDLSGDDEVLSDAASLTPGTIGTKTDEAVLHMRGKAWGVNDLAKAISGDDPMAAVGNLVAAYWARREQALLIATLKGVFADNVANDSSDLTYTIASETGASPADNLCISASAVITAGGRLGDSAEKLTAIVMHSTPFQKLQTLNLIEWIAASTAGTDSVAMAYTKIENGVRMSNGSIFFPYYLGKRVIVDDSCPKVAGSTSGYKYTTYLFGEGAIGRGEGNAPVPVETDRDSLAGEDYLINRRHFLLHPRGIAFISGSVAGSSPTNTELALAANWNRVYEKKNIRIVQLITNG